jgi:hypothetical protein
VTYHGIRVERSNGRMHGAVSVDKAERLRIADDVGGVEHVSAYPKRQSGVANNGLQQQEAAYSNRCVVTLRSRDVERRRSWMRGGCCRYHN